MRSGEQPEKSLSSSPRGGKNSFLGRRAPAPPPAPAPRSGPPSIKGRERRGPLRAGTACTQPGSARHGAARSGPRGRRVSAAAGGLCRGSRCRDCGAGAGVPRGHRWTFALPRRGGCRARPARVSYPPGLSWSGTRRGHHSGVGPCASPATVCVGRGGMWGWRAGLIHPGCPPSLEHPPFATGVVGSPCGQGERWAGGAGVRAGRQEAADRACAGRARAHPAAGLQPPPGRATAPGGVGQRAELRARPGQAERGALERGQVLVGVGHT